MVGTRQENIAMQRKQHDMNIANTRTESHDMSRAERRNHGQVVYQVEFAVGRLVLCARGCGLGVLFPSSAPAPHQQTRGSRAARFYPAVRLYPLSSAALQLVLSSRAAWSMI